MKNNYFVRVVAPLWVGEKTYFRNPICLNISPCVRPGALLLLTSLATPIDTPRIEFGYTYSDSAALNVD